MTHHPTKVSSFVYSETNAINMPFNYMTYLLYRDVSKIIQF